MGKKTLHTSEMEDSSEDFDAMYEANAPLIYRFMFWRTKDQMLSEDLTSNVFEKAWRNRTSFKGGSAKAWLHRIARNTLIDHWRKRQDFSIEDSVITQTVDETSALDDSLDIDMLIENLETAIGKLPKEMRQVVELRFIGGISAKKVGQRLGLSEANVRVIQYRALKKLRGYLNEQ